MKNNVDDFLDTLRSTDPIQVDMLKVQARDLLSGKVFLPTRYGMGIYDELHIREGDLLDSNVQVSFHPYKDTLFFHKKDNMLVVRILELIRNKSDQLMSGGMCVKPLYSHAKGFRNKSSKGDIYTYELTDLVSNRQNVTIPYYLYTRNPDGSHLSSAVPILAHEIRIHVLGDTYLKFKPNSISIPEILDLCRLKFKEMEPRILNIQWGLKDKKSIIQSATGNYQRSLHGLSFHLADLLSGDSFLPIEKRDGHYYLSQAILIVVSDSSIPYPANTPMSELWSRWKPISGDSDCICNNKYDNLCIFRSEPLFNGDELLPTIRGLVTDLSLIHI